MAPDTSNINSLWSSLIVEALSRHGIARAFVSPGSRSTPLTVAIARHPKMRPVVHFDERGAAFASIGYARATGQPAVLVCTSGSAVANYLPALVEAYQDMLPVIVLTADRPPELQDCGANQTIAQPGIYSHFVRHETDLSCPDTKVAPEVVLTEIDRAVATAITSPAGPVHINCPFREPLTPSDDGHDYRDYLDSIAGWLTTDTAYTTIPAPEVKPAVTDIHTVAARVAATETGIIILGRLESESDRDQAIDLSETLGWPILPDIQSGVRLGQHHPNVIGLYDLLLCSQPLAEELTAGVCLHLGGRLTSKRLLQWLDRTRPQDYIMVANHPRRHDPNHQVTMWLRAPVAESCRAIKAKLTPTSDTAWVRSWQRPLEILESKLPELVGDDLTEPAVAYELARVIDSSHALWLASSLPIRLLDSYAPGSGASVPIGANRGASGIDGTIASAVGFADGLGRPVTLLIGDLAFLHDLNSLALIRQSDQPITIVLLNNNGGGIFSLLPIAEHSDVFERFFTTPHGLSFGAAADQFGLEYRRIDSRTELTKAYGEAVVAHTSSIIEVIINREQSIGLMKSIAEAIPKLLSS
ncbi:2-succinyl-5-enolpyruvyl-6-hydroxy-3-cyclohexene-1-carboxylic-acid synthase [candidate division GN15 bacterium]|nr:2-succinyl-5-enolpyruvyl-6-hydroxy-3-cyclohexene-1-carboxylic-acid synthase [candidate division GN15 bacterium]